MEKERRESPRRESTCQLSILFKDREVRADLRNISSGGAFIHVAGEESHKITFADTGRAVTFLLTNGKSSVNYKGTVGRYTESDKDNKYVAIHFNQRTMHESS
jgi:hypothetical protein